MKLDAERTIENGYHVVHYKGFPNILDIHNNIGLFTT